MGKRKREKRGEENDELDLGRDLDVIELVTTSSEGGAHLKSSGTEGGGRGAGGGGRGGGIRWMKEMKMID